jgi:hypothetical protein
MPLPLSAELAGLQRVLVLEQQQQQKEQLYSQQKKSGQEMALQLEEQGQQMGLTSSFHLQLQQAELIYQETAEEAMQ